MLYPLRGQTLGSVLRSPCSFEELAPPRATRSPDYWAAQAAGVSMFGRASSEVRQPSIIV